MPGMALGTGEGVDILVCVPAVFARHLLIVPDRSRKVGVELPYKILRTTPLTSLFLHNSAPLTRTTS